MHNVGLRSIDLERDIGGLRLGMEPFHGHGWSKHHSARRMAIAMLQSPGGEAMVCMYICITFYVRSVHVVNTL